jgi:hypothetical protein
MEYIKQTPEQALAMVKENGFALQCVHDENMFNKVKTLLNIK